MVWFLDESFDRAEFRWSRARRKRIDDLVEKYLGAIRSRQGENAIGDELFSILARPILGEERKAAFLLKLPKSTF